MSLLRVVLQQEEGIVYRNEESFINMLSCCSYEGILDLTSVSFSSERVHFNYVLNSGQHVVDSCTMLDYLEWKETL